jgi:hypothetical protein
MAKYIQIVDGEGFTVPKGEKWRFACCDCGLVHDVVLVPGRKEIGMAVRRNNRATAQRRKPKPAATSQIASLQSQIDATYKQWTGRDFMHLPLPDAVGAVVSELRDKNDALQAQVEALRADAERYRWRHGDNEPSTTSGSDS